MNGNTAKNCCFLLVDIRTSQSTIVYMMNETRVKRMKQCTIIERRKGLVLWSIGNYMYQITKGMQPFKPLQTLTGYGYEAALEKFHAIAG